MPVMTPNMNLLQPVVGVDTGLTWEQSINANTGVLDGHNHSPGSGVQITPSGLNINSDLSFNAQNAIALRSVRFTPQTSPLSLPTDLGCLYESGVDLWYNDGSGNQIQITSGGLVNATSSGISSGTNTASFVSNVLVVNANTNTPANIQVASVLLGNNVVNSKYLTLSPPSAMAANYQLTLPTLPSVQSFMTLSPDGTMSAPWTVDGSTIIVSAGEVEVAPSGITPTQIANGAVTYPKLSALNIEYSSSSGAGTPISPSTYESTSPDLFSPVAITSQGGRPIQISLVPSQDNGVGGQILGGVHRTTNFSNGQSIYGMKVQILKNTGSGYEILTSFGFSFSAQSSGNSSAEDAVASWSGFTFYDTSVTSGTTATYAMNITNTSGALYNFDYYELNYMQLVVMEL